MFVANQCVRQCSVQLLSQVITTSSLIQVVAYASNARHCGGELGASGAQSRTLPMASLAMNPYECHQHRSENTNQRACQGEDCFGQPDTSRMRTLVSRLGSSPLDRHSSQSDRRAAAQQPRRTNGHLGRPVVRQRHRSAVVEVCRHPSGRSAACVWSQSGGAMVTCRGSHPAALCERVFTRLGFDPNADPR
jgi:hypothetical protein